jgi:hypothetical protein
MQSGINGAQLWMIPGLYFLGAVLVSPATLLFRSYKAKGFLVAVAVSNAVLAALLLLDVQNPGLATSALLAALSIGAVLTQTLTSRQNLPHAGVFSSLVFFLLSVTILSTSLSMTLVATILSGFVLSYAQLSTSSDEVHATSVAPLLFWHRISDLLLLFCLCLSSVPSLKTWFDFVFLSGIFIRASFLFAPTQLAQSLQPATSLTRTLYFFAMGQGGVVLLAKYGASLGANSILSKAFICLSVLWFIMAISNALLRRRERYFDICVSQITLASIFLLWLSGLQVAAIWMSILAYVLAAPLFIFGPGQSAQIQTPILGVKIDRLFYRSWTRLLAAGSLFFRRFIWPLLIYGVLVRMPSLASTLARLLLRFLSAGGAQKAMATLLVGILAFFFFYVDP